jgi:hypothetical protein
MAEGNGDDHTACGLPVNGPFLSKDTAPNLDLCPICYAPYERDRAKLKAYMRALKNRADHERDAWDDLDEPTPTEHVIEWIPNDWDRPGKKK